MRVASAGLHVHLVVEGMVPGHFHELHMDEARSEMRVPLLSSGDLYTLWQIADKESTGTKL